jgi:hypothetical protein
MDVISIFTNPAVQQISATVILAGVVVMILSGFLIPKRSHDQLIEKERRRGDEWKATALKAQERDELRDELLRIMIEGQKTSSEFFATVKGGRNVGT